MANYLPVLLVSVTAGMPDDAALQPLPRGQVDYLSHEWAEEDVWRSWRNMTKQKNEIANGVRLENASWRTWMKQRNNLKTVSPETLNWLKDSDVTWLYGPLHTAVDWEKPLKQVVDSNSATYRERNPTSSMSNSLSSPSSSVALDRMVEKHPGPPLRTSSHEHPSHGGSSAMKPILKHRSIAEMLTGALPPAPSWAEPGPSTRGDSEGDEEDDDDQDPRESTYGRKGSRPPLYHTRSDTNVISRFGRNKSRKESRVSPPRVADATLNREPDAGPFVHTLNNHQRSGASNNLLEMAMHANGPAGYYSQLESGQSSPYRREGMTDSPMNDPSYANHGVRFEGTELDEDDQALTPSIIQPPQKKHISFNAIVEQCISIEGGSVPATPSHSGPQWSSFDEESDEDFDMDDPSSQRNDNQSSARNASEIRDVEEDLDDDESQLEFTTSSRRNSTASLQDYQPSSSLYDSHDATRRPSFRRSSTGSRVGNGNDFYYSRPMGRGSATSSRSRSSGGAQDREHVTIAPIAPTILKAGGSDGFENGTLYMGGTPVLELNLSNSSNIRVHEVDGHSDLPNGLHSAGYGYGGYGFGEEVSAGRDDAYRNFERGTDAGELVFQSPNGNRYPWCEKDAIRFCMINEFGMPSPSNSPGFATHSPSTYFPPMPDSSDQAQFVPLQGTGRKDDSEQAEFEYFDEVDGARDNTSSNPRAKEEPKTSAQGPTPKHMLFNEEAFLPSHLSPAVHSGSLSRRITRGDSNSSSGDSDERPPSPEMIMKQNPRIVSLKTDGYKGQPIHSVGNIDNQSPVSSGSIPIPIVKPSLAPSSDVEPSYQLVMDSPTMQTGFLSPPDLSPRGRWLSNSPESSGSGTPSYLDFGSRSTSESRSDSRGRSTTRNSSVTSSDNNEPERGRSRSRSTASGANSPLRETASPISRSSTAGIGLGIGGSYGSHVGREIRDGRGTKLYRKTSEDNIGEHYDGRSAQSLRGRARDGKRISESLSPPVVTVVGSPPGDIYRAFGAGSSPTSVAGHRISGSPSRRHSRKKGTSSRGSVTPPPPPSEACDVPSVSPPETERTVLIDNHAAKLPSVAEDESGSRPEVLKDEPISDVKLTLSPPKTPHSNLNSVSSAKPSRNDLMSSAKSLFGAIWNGQ